MADDSSILLYTFQLRIKEAMGAEATEAHFLTQKSSLQSRFQVCDPTGFQYHLTELHLKNRKKNPCSVRFGICSVNLILC